MAQRQREWTVPLTEERAEEEVEDVSTEEENNEGRGGVAAEVGGVDKVPAPPGGRQATGKGKR